MKEILEKNIGNKVNRTLLFSLQLIVFDFIVAGVFGNKIGQFNVATYGFIRIIIIVFQFVFVLMKTLKVYFIILKKYSCSYIQMRNDPPEVYLEKAEKLRPILILVLEACVLCCICLSMMRKFGRFLRQIDIMWILLGLILIESLTCVIKLYILNRLDLIEQ
ncbi:hypothetical protein [Terrisporobacter sp.]